MHHAIRHEMKVALFLLRRKPLKLRFNDHDFWLKDSGLLVRQKRAVQEKYLIER